MSDPLNPNRLSPTWAWRDLRSWQAYLLAFVLSILFLKYMFSREFFNGNSAFFDPYVADNSLHMSSWWYFVADSWRWPILWTNRTDYPVGQNIAFTDSIPLAAISFKMLHTVSPKLLPAHFHYFGWWIGLSLIFQGISAVALIRALNVKSLMGTLAAILFALTWPPLHVRYPHTALMMQAVILYSLALYFHIITISSTEKRNLMIMVFVNVAALLIHPYLVVFTFGVFVASLIDAKFENKRSPWVNRVFWLVFILTVLLLIGFAFGYLEVSSMAGGYGHNFSFDLASPFCGDSKWSQCDYLKNGDGARHFEGYNYFGMGLLLLIPIALLLLRPVDFRRVARNNKGLIFIFVGMFVYSITHIIKFKGQTVFEYDLPVIFHWLVSTYRAAGRFFWLIGYAILFVALGIILKYKNTKTFLLIVVAVILQFSDISPQLAKVKFLAATPSSIRYEQWQDVFDRVDEVNMYPLWGCDNKVYNHIDAENVYQVTGYYGKLINSGYTARNNVNCERGEYLKTETFKARNLYAIGFPKDLTAKLENTLPKPFIDAIRLGECAQLHKGIFCLPGVAQSFW